jgi:predicted transposase YbfD/YdcC
LQGKRIKHYLERHASDYGQLFSQVEDPRVEARCDHLLADILFIALCTLLSNGEDFEDMAEFGLQRQEWLSTFLFLPNGIPSHDTFNRVLQMIDPKYLSEVLSADGARFIECFKGELINLDGKKIRGYSPRSTGNSGLYILSAWVGNHQLCIGQVAVDDKSNEITAIPKVLAPLDLTGATVSIDAIGCQTAIAEQIVDQGADYLLAVKVNQDGLYEEVSEAFTYFKEDANHRTWEYNHGRHEVRKCRLLSARPSLGSVVFDKWKGLSWLVEIKSERTKDGVTTYQTRYYISSDVGLTEDKANKSVRGHWSIENQLHWHLDVTFSEDGCRARRGNSAINLNTLRKIALQRVKLDTAKLSMKKRRFRASLNDDYLINLLML